LSREFYTKFYLTFIIEIKVTIKKYFYLKIISSSYSLTKT